MFHFFYVNFFSTLRHAMPRVTNSDAEFVTRQTKLFASSDAFSFVHFRLSKIVFFRFSQKRLFKYDVR